METYYYRLLDILEQAGWGVVYSVTSGRGRNSWTTYYIAPRQDELDAAGSNAVIGALIGTFGAATTYIYKIEDVANVWMLRGRDMLEITLPNK